MRAECRRPTRPQPPVTETVSTALYSPASAFSGILSSRSVLSAIALTPLTLLAVPSTPDPEELADPAVHVTVPLVSSAGIGVTVRRFAAIGLPLLGLVVKSVTLQLTVYPLVPARLSVTTVPKLSFS